MTHAPKLIMLLTLSLVATACGGGGSSPTSPTAVSTAPAPAAPAPAPAPAPTPAPTPAPAPAPAPTTLTGTWSGSGQTFSLTQNGTAVTGSQPEQRTDLGNSMTMIETSSITGTISGTSVTLTFSDRIRIVHPDLTMDCTAGHTFTGTLSGNTLSGTLVAGTTAFNCGSLLPPISVPQISGPMSWTRQ